MAKKMNKKISSIWLVLALAICFSIFMISHAMSRIMGQEWKQQHSENLPPTKEMIASDEESTKAASSLSQKPVAPHHEKIISISLSSTTVTTRRQAQRLSPPNLAAAESVQLDRETMIVVGGYIDSFKNVSRSIQFFNISSQTWFVDRTIELASGLGETHQGITFDRVDRVLYVVSGQLGPGCMPATTVVGRLHMDSEEFQFLPPLPLPRYAPGVVIITDPNRSTIKHLHVFGGASSNRNDSATDHWRLTIDEMQTNSRYSDWEPLQPLPDGGAHGASFLSPDGNIYYTGFCNLDPGMIESPSMAECHWQSVHASQQQLHHVSHAGLTFRYPTAFSTRNSQHDPRHEEAPHWERVADMPFPVCHGGSLVHNGNLYVIGGSILTPQTAKGSAPNSWPAIQMLDPTTNTWQATAFTLPQRRGRTHLFLLASWIDEKRRKVYSLHPGNALVTMDLVANAPIAETSSLDEMARRQELLRDYQEKTRQPAIASFQSCLREESDAVDEEFHWTVYTAEDERYEDLRGTWNKRHARKQYPHVVVQPTSPRQVSIVIQCAKRTGYHVCGRNGRHSYDGSTCTNGIVVDVSKFQTVEMMDAERGVVRLGAGLTLGQVVVALEAFGWALPAGTCSSVGVTGLTLNGGQGPLSRLHGLTSDHLTAVELVDDRGDILRATATNECSDLLWLARGGGSVGYHYPGIITGLEFANLVPLPRNQTVWTRARIRYTPATVDKATQLLSAWQDFYQDKTCQIDDQFCHRITAEPWLFLQYNRRKRTYEPALRLVVYFFGTKEQEHQRFITDYLPKFQGMVVPGGTVVSIERQDQFEFHRRVGGLRTVEQLSVPYLGHDVNASWLGLSAVAAAGKVVPPETFRSIAETIFLQKPRYRRYAEFKPLGGAIMASSSLSPSNVVDADSAFWHRRAPWWVLMNHFFDKEYENSQWLEDRIVDDLEGIVGNMMGTTISGDDASPSSSSSSPPSSSPSSSFFQGHYAGYVRHSNSTARDLQLYYGRHADRIREIKRARDPHNLFRHFLPNQKNHNP